MTDPKKRPTDGRIKSLALPIFVFVLIGLGLMVRNVDVATDLTFFSPGAQTERDAILFQQMSKADGIAMVAITGLNVTQQRKASETLIRALQAMPEVAHASNGGIDLDPKTYDFLVDHRYVLGPAMAADAFSVSKIRAGIQAGLAQLGGVSGYLYRDIFPRDPTGRMLEIARVTAPGNGKTKTARDEAGLWRDAQGRHLLLAILSISSNDIAGHARVLDAINRSLENGDAQALSAVVSGPGFFALNASKRIRAEMKMLTLIAFGAVALLLLSAFRAPSVLLAIGLPVGFGLLSGILVTAWIFGNVHGVAITFGAVMVGVAVDYPIHLMSLRADGETKYGTARRLFPTMALGAATTFVGFLTLSQSSFPGLAQIGTLSAVSVLVALLFSRFLLPWCLPDRTADFRIGRALWGLFGAHARTRRIGRWVLWGLPLVLIAIGTVTSTRIWDDDIRNLSVASKTQIHIDQDLRSALRLPDVSHFLRVHGDSSNDVMEVQWQVTQKLKQVQAQGAIGGYTSLSDVLPPPSVQRQRLEMIPDVGILRQTLAAATAGLPIDLGVFQPFLDDVARAKSSGVLEVERLPQNIKVPMMTLPQRSDDGWSSIVYLIAPVADLPADVINVDQVTFINLRQIANDVVARYRNEGLRLMALGAFVGLVVMIFGRRGVGSALKVLLTPMIAVATTAAFLVVIGTPLNLFHLLAFVLVVSIGVDYELFFAGYRVDAIEGAHSYNSVMMCFLTTGLAFAVLGTSSLPLLRALGTTVAMGATLSFLLTVLRFERESGPT